MAEEGWPEFFAALGEALAACSTVAEAADRSLEAMVSGFGAEGGLLLLRRSGGDALSVRAACGKDLEAARGRTLTAGRAAEQLEADAPLIFDSPPSGLPALLGRRCGAVACAPLKGRKRAFGLVLLTGGKAEEWGEAERAALGAAVRYTALVMEKLGYLRLGRRLASIDPVTGVRGRRSLEKILAAEIDRCRRYKTPLSVLWIELDDFKRITDTFGHDAADKVLVEAARILENNIRSVDTLARYGGDEFVVLLPNTGRENAQIVRQRILTDLEAYNAARQELPFGMSVGLHTAGPDGVEDILTYSDLDLKRRRYRSEELDLENLELHLEEVEPEEQG